MTTNAPKTNDFTTSFVVSQTPAQVFDAINNVRAWWSGEIEGPTDQLNQAFIYRVKDIHSSTMKVTTLIPDEKVVWTVTDSHLSFVKNKQEWTDTEIHFDITRVGDQTKLTFTHQGLVPEVECFNACQPAWTGYIQTSLKNLITSGKGGRSDALKAHEAKYGAVEDDQRGAL
jgi:hypothetical protein